MHIYIHIYINIRMFFLPIMKLTGTFLLMERLMGEGLHDLGEEIGKLTENK